jgi:hypothetical protein
MSGTPLSFSDVISHGILRQAQAPLKQIAEKLHIQEVSGQYDFRPVLQNIGEKITAESASLQLGEDNIVFVISPLISQDHFDPYQMAIFASSEIQAVGLRAELRTWIGYASEDLHVSDLSEFNNSQLLVDWYQSLVNADEPKATRITNVAHIAGLVTRYCHPQADLMERSDILQELKDLGNTGVNDANKVFELLTSPSSKIINDHEWQKHKEFIDSPITSLYFQLVEDSYELEIKRIINRENTLSDSRYPIAQLIQETRLNKQPIKIIFAGNLEDIHSIYCFYLLLKYQILMHSIAHVQVDIGVVDTVFYIAKEDRYVKALKLLFHKTRQNIPGLAYLIHSAVDNDFNNFQIKWNTRCPAPSEEELVLFYLRMLSPIWNNTFLNMIEKRNRKALKHYIKLKDKIRRFIPEDWQSAISAYWYFSDFIHRKQSQYSSTINTLPPINLMTDNQINKATVIVTASRKSMTKLIRRFPGGVANKVVFFSDIAPKRTAFGRNVIQSPYTPATFLSDAKWDPVKEKAINTILLKYIIPVLKQELSIYKIKAIKLVEQKRASREAIKSVQQYILRLQKRSMNGNDQALIDGLIFILAVIKDIDPYSDEWNSLIDCYRANRNELQDVVFEGKSRILSDFVAVKFLRHYVGPGGYADRAFPGVYQQYNDEISNLLMRNLGIASTSTYPGTEERL